MAAATQHSMPHGLGLLTTVASLPPKYRSRYLNIKSKCETPLDLSVKPTLSSPKIANDVPIATAFTEVYTEPYREPATPSMHQESSPVSAASAVVVSENCANVDSEVATFSADIADNTGSTVSAVSTVSTMAAVTSKSPISTVGSLVLNIVKPITPPLTPTKRKYATHLTDATVECDAAMAVMPERHIEETYTNPLKLAKTIDHPTTKRECTPNKPIRSSDSAPKTVKAQLPATKSGRNKATRKLKFDEETSSPVSGTIIRPLEDITDGTMQYSNGDIDPKYNIVEITEETKAELAAIKNVIGDYICRLCRIKFDDAFGLAQHRCACIVLLEYRCPECGKQFNCPANLASHRRWHKPKKEATGLAKKENRNTINQASAATAKTATVPQKANEPSYPCVECGKHFKRQAYLRKHQLTHANRTRRSSSTTPSTQEPKNVGVAKQPTPPPPPSLPLPLPMQTAESVSMSLNSYTGSSASSLHSYSGMQGDEDGVYATATSHCDYDADSLSDYSSSSAGYGRLQIVESAGLTEEENIAATALTNLRNCASVIQHTTLAH